MLVVFVFVIVLQVRVRKAHFSKMLANGARHRRILDGRDASDTHFVLMAMLMFMLMVVLHVDTRRGDYEFEIILPAGVKCPLYSPYACGGVCGDDGVGVCAVSEWGVEILELNVMDQPNQWSGTNDFKLKLPCACDRVCACGPLQVESG